MVQLAWKLRPFTVPVAIISVTSCALYSIDINVIIVVIVNIVI